MVINIKQLYLRVCCPKGGPKSSKGAAKWLGDSANINHLKLTFLHRGFGGSLVA